MCKSINAKIAIAMDQHNKCWLIIRTSHLDYIDYEQVSTLLTFNQTFNNKIK